MPDPTPVTDGRIIHCWTGKRDYMADLFGMWSPEHIAAYQEEHDSTCMLEADHEGAHEWTPDGEIGVSFVDEEDRPS